MSTRSNAGTERRGKLRANLRARRRALDADARRAAARAVAINLQRERVFRASRRVACYLAVGGELDTLPIIERAYQLKKEIYLPVLTTGRHLPALLFARYTPGDRLVANRFGIPEPDVPASRLVAGNALDLVLTPLVGFDTACNRLGMGGGFYDRSFHHLTRDSRWRHPHLIGIAYDLQRVARLSAAPWDVPLHAVVTDKQAYFRC